MKPLLIMVTNNGIDIWNETVRNQEPARDTGFVIEDQTTDLLSQVA